MTAGDATDCQPASLDRAEAGDRLDRILGAGRLESAHRQKQRGNESLVAANEGN